MLEIRNLSVRFLNRANWLIREFSAVLSPGEILWVRGKNGSGKSSLLYAVCNVIPQHIPAVREGMVLLNGNIISDLPLNRLIPQVSLCLANPAWELLFSDLTDELTFPLQNIGLSESEISERLCHVLALFNLNQFLHQPLSNLSFGWQKMVSLAVHAAISPRLLLLDEPFNGLSASNIQTVLGWISDFVKNQGMVILADHDSYISELNPSTVTLG